MKSADVVQYKVYFHTSEVTIMNLGVAKQRKTDLPDTGIFPFQKAI
jgi:hypothetical protein